VCSGGGLELRGAFLQRMTVLPLAGMHEESEDLMLTLGARRTWYW
jgi:hypothetical protein